MHLCTACSDACVHCSLYGTRVSLNASAFEHHDVLQVAVVYTSVMAKKGLMSQQMPMNVHEVHLTGIKALQSVCVHIRIMPRSGGAYHDLLPQHL